MQYIKPPHPFQKSFCVQLDNVFSVDECQVMIAASENKGYEKALGDVGDGVQELDEDYHNSYRYILDSDHLCKEIFRRVRHCLPTTMQSRQLLGLNERLRFLRYDPGQFFRPHFDGAYTTPDVKAKSKLTIMLYLNEEFQGGKTAFLPLDDVKGNKVKFTPKTGSVLIFSHHIFHESEEVTKGRMYMIHTDVMYRFHSNLCELPEWI